MSENGWTKGPYSFEQEMRGDGAPLPEYTITSDTVTLGDEPVVIASVYTGERTAALIAASPALAEALEEMVEAYWGVADDKNGDGHSPPPACIVRARAALDLAKGRTA